MRTEYKCVCDACGKVIELVNDENDVSMNAAKYQFCPTCYDLLNNFVVDLVTQPKKNTGSICR